LGEDPKISLWLSISLATPLYISLGLAPSISLIFRWSLINLGYGMSTGFFLINYAYLVGGIEGSPAAPLSG